MTSKITHERAFLVLVAALTLGAAGGHCPWPGEETGCVVDGVLIGVGSSIPAPDGCNTCTCTQGGDLACTERACLSARDACLNTDGVWDEGACGHTVCGHPPACDAIIPGCDCGPAANFVDGRGCVEDAGCSACVRDADCGSEQRCDAGVCVAGGACPEAAPTPGAACAGTLSCGYGQECCCDECFESFRCDCFDGSWLCHYTDACMAPSCLGEP